MRPESILRAFKLSKSVCLDIIGDTDMSFTAIKCPNCGADKVRTVRTDVYLCAYCGSQFTMVRPDVQRTDIVSHNCTSCGIPR